MTVMQFGANLGPLLARVSCAGSTCPRLYLIDAITACADLGDVRLAPMPPTNGGQSARGHGAEHSSRSGRETDMQSFRRTTWMAP